MDLIPNPQEDANEAPELPGMAQQLEQFRLQWQRELTHRERKESTGSDGVSRQVLSMEDEARYWFLLGVEEEKKGQFFQAIQFYRRAVHLVPDIEFKIEFPVNSARVRQESESSYEDCEISEDEDLLSRFQHLQTEEASICHPAHAQRGPHISCLPVEILMYIFKWVVSSELDVISLEQLSVVCRGFYLCARDEELWRLVCLRVWGINCGKPSGYGSWRNMYIHRPHLRFNGCYISKCTYYRHGEASLDSFYKPIHTVEYYRYIRFFPEGKMLMVTTAEEPTVTVSKLRPWNSKIQGLLQGYYKMAGDQVTGVLKRRKMDNETGGYRYKRQQRQQQLNTSEQTFHVEFVLKHLRQRTNSQLVWNSYSVTTKYRNSNNESTSQFDLNNKTYPPLVFSQVKSYTSLSVAPLE